MSVTCLLTTGYSATAPTEKVLVMRKSGYNPAGGLPIALYCHSAGQDATEPLRPVLPPYTPNSTTTDRLIRAVAEAGYLVVAADLGLKLWGDDTQLSRVTEAVAYARSVGGRSGPLQILGFSMGGMCAFAWTRANPSEVASICAFVPAVDLNDFVVNNRAGQAASVNSAFGGAYNDAVHGPTHSPVQFASQIPCPVDLWHSPDDNTCVDSTELAMIAGLPHVTPHQISGDHGSALQFDGISISTTVNALDAHRP